MPLRTALLAAALAASAACRRDHDEVGRTTTTSAGLDVVMNDDAVDRIAAARCAREHACALAAGVSGEDPAACKAQVLIAMRAELAVGTCPLGVDRLTLQQCVGTIRALECGTPEAVLDNLSPCRSTQLCRVQARPR